jgi:hypothetical protein
MVAAHAVAGTIGATGGERRMGSSLVGLGLGLGHLGFAHMGSGHLLL